MHEYIKNKEKTSKSYFLVFLLMTFFIGFATSHYFYGVKSQMRKEKMSLFWKVWDTMEKKYPFQKPKDQDKIYDAIQGLVASYGDEYSYFFPPSYAKIFQEETEGEFAGLGMEVGVRDAYLVVIAPLKNSPAEKAGIQAGDIILKIDGRDFYQENLTLKDIIALLRGKLGTEVSLEILRPSTKAKKLFKIRRGKIEIPVLDTKIIDDVFVISLYNFNENIFSHFRDALREFQKSGKNYLLIDLRNNPGGYLSQAIKIMSFFFDPGQILLKEDFGKNGKIHLEKSIPSPFSLKKNLKMAILINRGSASASEIFAGAFQDYGKAIILGEKSYGKGSVQELIPFSDGSSLKVTIAKWLTPKGRQISQKGIEPDVKIKTMDQMDDEKILRKAIQIFKKKYNEKVHK